MQFELEEELALVDYEIVSESDKLSSELSSYA